MPGNNLNKKNKMENIAVVEQPVSSERVFDIMYSGGLCWSVDKEQLKTQDDLLAPSWCTRRSDTKGILGVVGSTYRPFQNQEFVGEFLEAVRQFGLTEIEGSSINGGKKVVLKAKVGTIQLGSDLIHRYITGSNTHDGSEPLRLGSYHRVKVCSNGLHRNINVREITRVKHTTNAGEKMRWYLQGIPQVLKMEEEILSQYKKLSEVPVTDEHVKQLIKKVYEVDPEVPADQVSPKKAAQVRRFWDALKNNGTSVHGNTLWGVLNAATYVNSRDTKGRLSEDKQFTGRSMELSSLTLDALMEMIDLKPELV